MYEIPFVKVNIEELIVSCFKMVPVILQYPTHKILFTGNILFVAF